MTVASKSIESWSLEFGGIMYSPCTCWLLRTKGWSQCVLLLSFIVLFNRLWFWEDNYAFTTFLFLVLAEQFHCTAMTEHVVAWWNNTFNLKLIWRVKGFVAHWHTRFGPLSFCPIPLTQSFCTLSWVFIFEALELSRCLSSSSTTYYTVRRALLVQGLGFRASGEGYLPRDRSDLFVVKPTHHETLFECLCLNVDGNITFMVSL